MIKTAAAGAAPLTGLDVVCRWPGQLVRVVVEPSQGRVEQRPWQQEFVTLVAIEPALQVRGQVLGAPLHELAALLQPASQAGPGAQECLVGDLDGGLAAGGGPIRGEQPGVDEPLNEALVVLVPLREPGWPGRGPACRSLGWRRRSRPAVRR